jgi:methylated-DNA-protein-cysteine methyltransferase-like protein
MRAKPVTAAQAYPKICAVVKAIPRGRVASYAQVAWLAGFPGRARMVGRALSDAGAAAKLPWHRVINAAGKIALPKSSTAYVEQKSRLVAEGVLFEGDRISLRKYGWRKGDAPVID